MTLAAHDELPHKAPPDAPATWQENWFFMGWDDESRRGFYLHVGRLPATHEQEVKAMVLLGDEVVSCAARHPLAADLEATGFRIDFAEPFSRTHLAFEGRGRLGPGPGMFFATGEGSIPIAFDLTLTAVSPPVDWAELLARMAVGGTEGTHYEQGFRWDGSLRAGDQHVAAGGLGVRDHTWGAREYDRFQDAWWTPMCFEDGSYLTGVSVGVDGRWVGGGLHSSGASTTMVAHAIEITGGHADAGAYRTAVVGAGDGIEVRCTTRFHLPVPYPSFGSPFLSSEAFSAVERDGRRGFASVEYNRALRPAELRQLGLSL